MLYVTEEAFSLVYHSLKEKHGPNIIIYNDIGFSELQYICSLNGSISEDMETIIKRVNIVKSNKITKLENVKTAKYNETYIIVNKLDKDWIEFSDSVYKVDIGNIKKEYVDPLRSIFTEQAFNYFWYDLCKNKFQNKICKWKSELIKLLIHYSETGELITRNYLEENYVYENINYLTLLNNLGTLEGRRIINSLSDSDCYLIFHKAYICKKLDIIKANNLVPHYLQLFAIINDGILAPKKALIIFNELVLLNRTKHLGKNICLT